MDKVGKFDYSGKFWDRYQPFFDACRTLPADAKVLIIGANDGKTADPTQHAWQPGWQGYFIEPNPKVRPDHGTVIHAAVSDAEGELTLYTMSDEAAAAYVRVGAHGSCLTSFDPEHARARLKKNLSATYARLGDSAIESFTVRCAPIADLVPGVQFDLIQIDIEGMEPLVVPQAIRMRPKVLMYEHQHLHNDYLSDMARQHGYTVTRLKNDTLATL